MSAGVTAALHVNMKDFKALLKNLSPDTAVCVRGRHAIGKSEGVYQAATEQYSDVYKDEAFCAKMVDAFGGSVKHADGQKSVWTYEDGLPVMERRLSQMTEGDTIGLPFNSDYGTVFKACDWLVKCVHFPAVLFLDERNRALDGVKQSVFQLCDSKAFYGNKLHDETRVLIAENVGDEYQVQACDPAEVSRTAVVILEPSQKDWLTYVEGKCNLATIEFIRQHGGKLEHKGNFEPNKKYPDRRSWFKCDAELQRLGLFEEPENHLFYVITGSMLGSECAVQFTNFCKERDRQISAKDVIKNWKKSKKRLAGKASVSNEMYVEVVNKLSDLLKTHKLSENEAEQIGFFMHDCPMEICMVAWAAMQKNVENLFLVHPYIEELMVKTARYKETTDLENPTQEEAAAKSGATTTTTTTSKKKTAATKKKTAAAVPAPKQRGATNKQRTRR